MTSSPLLEVELTHILVVGKLEQAKTFYRDVLGATVYREYGGTSCVLQFAGAWLLLVTGGGPTEDKPDITFAAPRDANQVSHAMTLRVQDCNAAYEELRSRGAQSRQPKSSIMP